MAAIARCPLDLRGGFELGRVVRVDVDVVRGNARELRSTHRLPVKLLRHRRGRRGHEDLRTVRGVEAISGDMKPEGYRNSDHDEQDTSHTAESPSRRTVMLQWSFRGNERVGIPRLAAEDIHDALRGRRSRFRLDMRLVARRDGEGECDMGSRPTWVFILSCKTSTPRPRRGNVPIDHSVVGGNRVVGGPGGTCGRARSGADARRHCRRIDR